MREGKGRGEFRPMLLLVIETAGNEMVADIGMLST